MIAKRLGQLQLFGVLGLKLMIQENQQTKLQNTLPSNAGAMGKNHSKHFKKSFFFSQCPNRLLPSISKLLETFWIVSAVGIGVSDIFCVSGLSKLVRWN